MHCLYSEASDCTVYDCLKKIQIGMKRCRQVLCNQPADCLVLVRSSIPLLLAYVVSVVPHVQTASTKWWTTSGATVACMFFISKGTSLVTLTSKGQPCPPSPAHPHAAILFKGFEPLATSSSIQFANGSDWEDRRKCLYSTLKGEDLESYFPFFVQIAQVRHFSASLAT